MGLRRIFLLGTAAYVLAVTTVVQAQAVPAIAYDDAVYPVAAPPAVAPPAYPPNYPIAYGAPSVDSRCGNSGYGPFMLVPTMVAYPQRRVVRDVVTYEVVDAPRDVVSAPVQRPATARDKRVTVKRRPDKRVKARK